MPEVQDSRQIARQHYDELQVFLASHLAKEPQNSRVSAREKLTRLTKQQFQELSTDVYDELVRRNNNSEQNEVPFLPVRDDFHPKRNQARQKLATLPKTRFKDLSSDVFYELGRRYPEFKEAEVLDDVDDSPHEGPPRNPPLDALREESQYGRKGSQDTIGNGSFGRKASGDSANTGSSRTPNGGRASPYSNGTGRRPSEETSLTSTRRPSEDTSRPAPGPNSLFRKVSMDSSYTPSVAPSTATPGMIIPTKSTIAEEEIQVPYGNDDEDKGDESEGTVESPNKPRGKAARTVSHGFGALGANLLNTPLSPATDDEGMEREQKGLYDQLSVGRASIASSGSGLNGTRGVREEREAAEQMRSEYEFKIATMQNKMANLENELAAVKEVRVAPSRVFDLGLNRDRLKARSSRDELQEELKELEELRARVDEQAAVIRSLQRDLDESRAARDKEARQREAEGKRHNAYEAQIQELQNRIEDLESNGTRRVSPEATNELRAEMQNLVDELKELAQRNDELLADKDADQTAIYNLTSQLKDYKRKYEHAKTELRNFKATSQLFAIQTPKSEDALPLSENGGISDIHVNAFQTSVDSFLSAARSNPPSGVIAPMRNIVNAVAAIADDLRSFEQRPPRERPGLDEESLRLLRERIEATLSNLATATKTHATSHGLSPVSLLDAATSHVSAAVIAAIHAVMMRKATAAERERERLQESSGVLGHTSSPLSNQRPLGASPSLKSVNGLRNSERHGRSSSQTSQWSNGGSTRERGDNVYSPSRQPEQIRRVATVSDRSSNASPQMTPVFETSTVSGGTNGTSEEEGVEDAWEELKPYLDAQSESIVLPIRNLLSSIRAGGAAPELNENLTQIITIVSSIVAVCKDSLPPNSAGIGQEILQQLGENCNKLSELQSQDGEITKPTRQAMASASFAIAKAMKELRAL
ncbi:component of the polarisome [Tulasnella sp. 403]|nr:component of the polarisome [Tulasnella sp. 403]